MTSNFLQFDASGTNLLSDVSYAANAFRANGFPVGVILPSDLHNKYLYQTTTMVAALGTALSNAGENVADSNLAGLVSSISNVFSNGLPAGYINGPPPQWASITSLSILAGLRCRSSDNTTDIATAGTLTLSISVTGANGLDVGTVSANTWYYVYLIKNPTTGAVASLFSLVNESASGSITLPAGYTKKRQLALAIRTNASAQIIRFTIGEGWPLRPLVLWNVLMGDDGAGGVTQIGGITTITTATVSAAVWIPPISQLGYFKGAVNQGAGATFGVFGYSGIDCVGLTQQVQAANNSHVFLMPTDATQSVFMRLDSVASSGRLELWVGGFVVTGVN